MTPDGAYQVGDVVTLLCRVLLEQTHPDLTLRQEWFNSEGVSVSLDEYPAGSPIDPVPFTLGPVNFTDAGVFTCDNTIYSNSPYILGSDLVSVATAVNVQSKLHVDAIMYIIINYCICTHTIHSISTTLACIIELLINTYTQYLHSILQYLHSIVRILLQLL